MNRSATGHDLFVLSDESILLIDSMYQCWLVDSNSVADDWNYFFTGMTYASKDSDLCDLAANKLVSIPIKYAGVLSLISRYRTIGFLQACTDPLSPCLLDHPLLSPANFGLEISDFESTFSFLPFIKSQATLREIIEVLQATYCREIGAEFMQILDAAECQWLLDRMESTQNRFEISREESLQLLRKLHESSHFELLLQRRFPAQKRFSLEGGEVLIPVLDAVVRNSHMFEIKDIILGMAHRGRLNVLATIFGKPYEDIFAEFRDKMSAGFIGDGDVKYHKGYSTKIDLQDGQLHLTLASNPSHLEAVNPVVEGKCRARQDRYVPSGRSSVLPLLIHGDSAFAGQGSVMEVLNMSRLEGYQTGGTLHIVLNNQIGFTTAPRDSRSTLYATDVAKMLACPIFHVQGESPEAAVHVIRLALEYRRKFARDVVVELICYRRHGHNEGDEPAFTQPLMYQTIAFRPPVNKIYANELSERGIPVDVLDSIEQDVITQLQEAFEKTPHEKNTGFHDIWSTISSEYTTESVDTSVPAEKLLLLSRKLAELPPGFNPHPKIHALVQKRFESVLKNSGIDWGSAETLAYATLLNEGVSVRLSGQDTRRGTFSHRHCVIHDMNDDCTYTPLVSVSTGTASFQAWDSLLSEFGVLGFEYGYSLESPHGLTVWEAQFGDFANGAQVIIDQFISSGETKWNRASGLVLLLPHGYEGQGAEHSSARIERFLQLCANHNMIVANPSTPAQLFHLLRRQIKQAFRKPLIVFSPKSLLRHPRCVSTVDDLTADIFHEVLCEPEIQADVTRLIICSGKIFYDLIEVREKHFITNTAIIRIEQLYPLRSDLLDEALSGFSAECSFTWVQEEPENMGAWSFIRTVLTERCPSVRYVGRPADSCPAVGSHHLHLDQQDLILKNAFEMH